LRSVHFALSLIVMGCATPKQPPPMQPRPSTLQSSLIGTWAADARTKGGLGAALLFADDQSVTSTFGALVDFSYELRDGVLRTTFTDEKGNPSTTSRVVRLAGDTLELESDDSDPAKRVNMARVGLPIDGGHSILGTWRFQHYTGVPATWQYTSTGLALLSVLFTTKRGKFAVKNGSMTISWDDGSTENFGIELTRTSLVLLKPERQVFTRVIP
jgi:hypothetical protein